MIIAYKNKEPDKKDIIINQLQAIREQHTALQKLTYQTCTNRKMLMQELTFIESHDGRKMRINNAIALIVTMIRDANANNSQASTQFKIPRKASYVILELELVTGLHELQMHILQLKKCL